MWWVDLGELPDTHPARLSPSSTRWGEKEMEKLMGQDDKDMGKTPSALLPIKIELMLRNKDKN